MKDSKTTNASRRSFLRTSAAAAVGAPAFQRKLRANDRIRTGHIGVGNRGTQLLHRFMEEKDVEIAALCDVYKPFLERDDSKVDRAYIESVGGYL